jgi:hypothetical protein
MNRLGSIKTLVAGLLEALGAFHNGSTAEKSGAAPAGRRADITL